MQTLMSVRKTDVSVYLVVVRTWPGATDVCVTMATLMLRMAVFVLMLMSAVKRACVNMDLVLIWMAPSNVYASLAILSPHLAKLVWVSDMISVKRNGIIVQ